MKSLFRAVLFAVIISAGVGAFFLLASGKTEAKRKPVSARETVVEVIQSSGTEQRALVSAMGTVIPDRSVTLSPEVGGRIVAQHKNLVQGGRFKKNQIMVRIDDRDYDLALAQQQANLASASMNLAVEQGRKVVAEREWNLIQEEVRPTEQGRKLALREVHLDNAQAAVNGAKSGLEKARLNLDRTVLRAPFNAVVTDEFVDVGQVVAPGTRIATLVDSDRFLVRVAVPMDRLSWIKIPGLSGKEGSPARITQKVGAGESVRRSGRVIRLLGDLDPVGKMARVLVEVDNPLGGGNDEDVRDLPLLLGAYVSVEIEGPMLDDIVVLPRLALREDNRVWVKAGDKLSIRNVDVVWSNQNSVFVKGDLAPGEDVITSRIGAPVEGMKLRLEDEGSSPEEPSEIEAKRSEKK